MQLLLEAYLKTWRYWFVYFCNVGSLLFNIFFKNFITVVNVESVSGKFIYENFLSIIIGTKEIYKSQQCFT